MIDFLTAYPTYVVLICALVIWLGLALYLWRIDNRLSTLESTEKRS